MVQHGLMPLLFHEHLISDYQRTLVHYYSSKTFSTISSRPPLEPSAPGLPALSRAICITPDSKAR